MPTRTQAHEGGTNVTIHIGKQFLILHLTGIEAKCSNAL
jgi:hypothetical protein